MSRIMTLFPLPLRVAAALGLACLATTTFAADRPSLRGDVTAANDTITLGDLVAHVPAPLADAPLFRAPALGATGTIQARRILSAAEALGVSVETGGRLQVTVSRAARTIGPNEIETAIKRRLAKEYGADPASTGISFDGAPPALVVAPDVTGEIRIADLTLDRRSRRVAATVWIGPSVNERLGQTRVGGIVVDLVDVVVTNRTLERGQAVGASDVTLERRARDLVPAEAVYDGMPLDGRVARRAIAPGTLLRAADLVRPEIVQKGELVTVVYEGPGISLALRAKANEAGALGDTVTVLNPQSKKTLQATVTGPGRVSVGGSSPAKVADATSTR